MEYRFEFDKVHGNKRSGIGRKGHTVYVDLFFNFWSLFYCFSVDRHLFIYLLYVCAHIGQFKNFDWVINMKKEKHNKSGQCVAVLQPDI